LYSDQVDAALGPALRVCLEVQLTDDPRPDPFELNPSAGPLQHAGDISKNLNRRVLIIDD